MSEEKRIYHRFETHIPILFTLYPSRHSIPTLRKTGVRGTARNISLEGLMIQSRFDLLDVLEIFPEEMDDDSPFELEVVMPDFKGKRLLIRGSVRWYRLSEPDGDIRHFQAGLYLKDDESRAVARSIAESTIPKTTNRARGASVKAEIDTMRSKIF